MRGGYYYANDKPGWGIEIDEKPKPPSIPSTATDPLNGGWGVSPPAGRPDHQAVSAFWPLPAFAGKGGPGSRG